MGHDFVDGFGYFVAGYGNRKGESLGRGVFAKQEYLEAAALCEWGRGNSESTYACKEAVPAYGMRPEMEST